jgi:3-mercaptopyruvate sulfurtransferase SseA
MKKQLRLINGEWKQILNPNLTPEERAVLENTRPENLAAIRELAENINARSVVAALAEDSATAQTIYDQHKIEGAEFIDCHIALPDGSGLINCRVENEHKQIRF